MLTSCCPLVNGFPHPGLAQVIAGAGCALEPSAAGLAATVPRDAGAGFVAVTSAASDRSDGSDGSDGSGVAPARRPFAAAAGRDGPRGSAMRRAGAFCSVG